jgi:hypothetical protein
MKSSAEEERLVVVLLYEARDAAGGVAIGLVFILVVGRQPGELDASLHVLPGGALLSLGGLVLLFRVVILDRILFDAGVFRNVPGDSVLITALRDLADASGEVAVIPEMLRKEDDVSEIGARPGDRCSACEQRGLHSSRSDC